MRRDLSLFSGEKTTEKGSYQHLYRHKGQLSKEWGQTPFSGAQRHEKGQQAQSGMQEGPLGHEEKLLYFEG